MDGYAMIFYVELTLGDPFYWHIKEPIWYLFA